MDATPEFTQTLTTAALWHLSVSESLKSPVMYSLLESPVTASARLQWLSPQDCLLKQQKGAVRVEVVVDDSMSSLKKVHLSYSIIATQRTSSPPWKRLLGQIKDDLVEAVVGSVSLNCLLIAPFAELRQNILSQRVGEGLSSATAMLVKSALNLRASTRLQPEQQRHLDQRTPPTAEQQSTIGDAYPHKLELDVYPPDAMLPQLSISIEQYDVCEEANPSPVPSGYC
ncbi:hypothetical protein FGO68_gene7350 [Halteria grandinella]|uniref:Uncharacterized protein n=1 Tax=Halteria grandinella TaxID=5974 RepID=A0A8J8NF81_HALGN|nr:hypothetical protein FGO68_gene7350 [Halteria grandinella]